MALRQFWGLAPLTPGDVVSLLSNSLPLLVNLMRRFMKFIHKALNHMSPVISSVAKLSIKNPWSHCGGNYCNIRYEYNMREDVSAKFLVKHKLINTSQHGFIKARSCLTNIFF